MIRYRLAEARDLPKVVKTHMACFPGYFLTSLGEVLLQKYYREYLEEDNLFILAERNEEIVGFAMGYLRGSNARRRFERKCKCELAWFFFIRCMQLDRLAFRRVTGKVRAIFRRRKPATEPLDQEKRADFAFHLRFVTSSGGTQQAT